MQPAPIPVIDCDTHVIEPYDLWTERLSAKWGERTPHVRWDAEQGKDLWIIDGRPVCGAADQAMAGWPEFPPDHPSCLADVDPSTWDAGARLRMMDRHGIRAQILYPNIGLFNADRLMGMSEAALQHDIVRAYNDWQTEWSKAGCGRFIPVTSLPFWNLQWTMREIERCADLGHRGIVFTQDPSAFGLPALDDPHWYPMWALAEEIGVPVNFHIGTGGTTVLHERRNPANGRHTNYVSTSVSFFLANSRTITLLVCGGICHRFPDLNFVSVESGIGWLPYFCEAFDWQWVSSGAHREHPEYGLLPSEFIRRQIYACFWFEHESAIFAIEAMQGENILFETDFPHPTSMSPGPASPAVAPPEYIGQALQPLSEPLRRKVLHDNAARIYGLAV